MTAYLYSAPNGVPGELSRTNNSKVEPAMLIAVSTVFAQSFGIAMVQATGGMSQYGASNTAADLAGILLRSVPSISGPSTSGTQLFADGTPNPNEPNNICTSGFVNVLCKVGTPARGGVVYIRVVAASQKLVGDFEATSDSTNSIAQDVKKIQWATDGVDGFLNAEVRVSIA